MKGKQFVHDFFLAFLLLSDIWFIIALMTHSPFYRANPLAGKLWAIGLLWLSGQYFGLIKYDMWLAWLNIPITAFIHEAIFNVAYLVSYGLQGLKPHPLGFISYAHNIAQLFAFGLPLIFFPELAQSIGYMFSKWALPLYGYTALWALFGLPVSINQLTGAINYANDPWELGYTITFVISYVFYTHGLAIPPELKHARKTPYTVNLGCPIAHGSAKCVDTAPLDGGVIQMDAVEYLKSLPHDHVGYIIAENLIEHLPNPHELLAQAYRVLWPQGKLILRLDNMLWPFYHLPITGALTLGAYALSNYTYLITKAKRHTPHYWLFSPFTVKNLLENYGFHAKVYPDLIRFYVVCTKGG